VAVGVAGVATTPRCLLQCRNISSIRIVCFSHTFVGVLVVTAFPRSARDPATAANHHATSQHQCDQFERTGIFFSSPSWVLELGSQVHTLVAHTHCPLQPCRRWSAWRERASLRQDAPRVPRPLAANLLSTSPVLSPATFWTVL